IDSSTGQFTFTPTSGQAGHPFSVTVRVTDNGSPAQSRTTTFNINVAAVNTAPTITAIPDKSAVAGSQLPFNGQDNDPDTPAQTLTYRLDAGFPTGAVINSSTGAFTFTPTNDQAGQNFTVTVRVTDNGSPNMSSTATFHINVAALNHLPVITSIPNKTVNPN